MTKADGKGFDDLQACSSDLAMLDLDQGSNDPLLKGSSWDAWPLTAKVGEPNEEGM